MKTLRFFMVFSLMLVFGCDKPDEGLNIHLNTSFLEYMMQIEFVDGTESDLGSIEDIDLTIEAAGPTDVLELSGEAEYEVADGRITLILNPAVFPEGDDAYEFTIKAEAPGYLPINKRVAFTNDEKTKVVRITMVDKSNPPAGVGYRESQADLNDNNRLISDLVIDIPKGGAKKTASKLRVNAGTEFIDANGNIISGDELSVEVMHFDASGVSSLESFPGGFTPEAVTLEGGNIADDIYFQSAGFVSIDMYVDGIEVKEFSDPITVTMDIEPDAVNLDDAPIQVGDEIPVWSYEVETGDWAFEKIGVVENTSDGLQLTFEAEHLSWWNIDYYGFRCYYGPQVTITTNASSVDYHYAELEYANGNLFRTRILPVYNNNGVRFYNMPQNRQFRLKIYQGQSWYNKGVVIAESGLFGCGQDANVNITVPAVEEICVDVDIVCENDNTIISPNASVYYRDYDGTNGYGWWRYLGFVYNGEACTTSLQVGTTYEFAVGYKGKFYFSEYTIETDNIVVNPGIDCDDFDIE